MLFLLPAFAVISTYVVQVAKSLSDLVIAFKNGRIGLAHVETKILRAIHALPYVVGAEEACYFEQNKELEVGLEDALGVAAVHELQWHRPGTCRRFLVQVGSVALLLLLIK